MKNRIFSVFFILNLVLIAFSFMTINGYATTESKSIEKNGNSMKSKTSLGTKKFMSLDLYLQNKEIAEILDCGATRKVTYQVPRTMSPIHVSLKILFEKELARYGTYKSVIVSKGIARVYLKKFYNPALSSCESSHLVSVIEDTLTQYKSVQSIELYSPNGRIQF